MNRTHCFIRISYQEALVFYLKDYAHLLSCPLALQKDKYKLEMQRISWLNHCPLSQKLPKFQPFQFKISNTFLTPRPLRPVKRRHPPSHKLLINSQMDGPASTLLKKGTGKNMQRKTKNDKVRITTERKFLCDRVFSKSFNVFSKSNHLTIENWSLELSNVGKWSSDRES